MLHDLKFAWRALHHARAMRLVKDANVADDVLAIAFGRAYLLLARGTSLALSWLKSSFCKECWSSHPQDT